MFEDPVKLYVVVMTVLLLVLGAVAFRSYNETRDYEMALERAPTEAKQLRKYGAEVNRLITQLGRSKIGEGEVTLVSRAAKRLGIRTSGIQKKTNSIRGRASAQEKTVVVTFGSGSDSNPLPRKKIAEFCQAVEVTSQRILKTMELDLTRVTGKGLTDPGKAERVNDDVYRGRIIFGTRVIVAPDS